RRGGRGRKDAVVQDVVQGSAPSDLLHQRRDAARQVGRAKGGFEVARFSRHLPQVLEYLLGRESTAVLAARAEETDGSRIGETLHARLADPEQLGHLTRRQRAPHRVGGVGGLASLLGGVLRHAG